MEHGFSLRRPIIKRDKMVADYTNVLLHSCRRTLLLRDGTPVVDTYTIVAVLTIATTADSLDSSCVICM